MLKSIPRHLMTGPFVDDLRWCWCVMARCDDASSIPSASVMKILMRCSEPKHFKVSYKIKSSVYCDIFLFVCFVCFLFLMIF